MQNNKFKRELVFSVISISVYFALLNLANKLSSAINTPNSINALVGIVFFLAVIVYLKKKMLLSYYGINSLKELDYKNLLFCAPMIVVASVNLRYGINIDNSWEQVIFITLKMLGVGFAEEILFRSFLMKAIMNKSTTAAVIVSSTVFGMIHIFNLLYGADTTATLAQVVFATALGLMFSMFFFKTNNIVPCVICHSIINMTNMFLPNDLSNKQLYTGWIIIIIPSVFYAFYLYKTEKALVKKNYVKS
ncbi:MAG: CPBP family intramembrane metalloprotease [Clostridia bacterium]|nr:CPBP family intramembrane metalloprotease [Clostridia bacterium]